MSVEVFGEPIAYVCVSTNVMVLLPTVANVPLTDAPVTTSEVASLLVATIVDPGVLPTMA